MKTAMKKLLFMAAAAAALIALITAEHAFAEEEIQRYGNYRYVVRGNTVTIVDYGYGLSDEELEKTDFSKGIVIPDKINGMKVTEVKKKAFEPTIGYSYKCTRVKCSDYMKDVSLESFNCLSELKTITLGKYTRSFDPYGRYRGTIIELSRIKVPEGAAYLKTTGKGVLYSKDGTVLYAVPQKMKGSFHISSRTKKIGKHAFVLSRLRKITFPKGIRKISSSAFKGYDVNSRKTLRIPRAKVKKIVKALKRSGAGLYRNRIIKY